MAFRVLIIGGTGQVGAAVVRALIAEPSCAEVVMVNRKAMSQAADSRVRVVTLAYGRWDWHGKPHGTTFENARHHLPVLDRGLTVLLEDLRLRGLEKDVTVLVWGEFGRTPRINKMAGRDHWPQVGCALLAGGGMKTGQVIGSTTAHADLAKDRPVRFSDIFATLYRNMGINPETTTITDTTDRPQHLVEGQALPELI